MERLFSYLLILSSCLCLFLNLPSNFVKADDAAATTALCNAVTKSLECANLGTVSYPFGDAEPCAASDSFLLSDCSSSQAYWDAFSSAAEDELLKTAVTGIFSLGSSLTFINLTWNIASSSQANACHPLSADSLNLYIPNTINLTNFANGSFLLSLYNHILLLNCSRLPSSSPDLQINNAICRDYQQQCGILENTPCAQIVVPTQKLLLEQALRNYSCAAESSTPIPSWQQGLIQVVHADAKCEACYWSGGQCIYDAANNSTFQKCACEGTYSDTNCRDIKTEAMERLFSYLLILSSCLCLFLYLPSNFVKADDAAATTALCNAVTKSLECANLGTVSYPFGDAEPCAASDSFLLSDCSSSQAFWAAFSQFALGTSAEDKLLETAVTGIFSAPTFHLTFINLTWNIGSSSQANACHPLSADSLNLYIPNTINLTNFANGSFLLSLYNHILLLNCSRLPFSSPDLQINNTVCRDYKQQCGILENTPCAQIVVPTQKLLLEQALQNYYCTHFQFLVAAESSTPIPSWQQGLIQVVYGDAKCEACYWSGGQCIYDAANNSTFQNCACEGTYSDTNCRDIKTEGCKGLLCNTRAKITIGVVGTVLAAIAVIIIGIVLIYRTKKRGFSSTFVPFRSAERSTRQRSSSLTISHLDVDGLMECPVEYQYTSIVLATKSFSNLLGEGGFGAVYKGTLGDAKDDVHVHIAVKVLEVRSKHSKKQFLNEVACIGRIHHVNVVRLLGFCIENLEMLVYEYVINGSLDKWLFHRSGSRNPVLLWEQRYAIAIGIAKGLSYLHEECRHRIVHCDIKPQNILLDEHMCPKIADFGLARLMGREESRVTTCAKGTPGYMGPEFWLGGESQLSTKFDVYSYGMVLLELISGQRNFGHGVYFPETAFEAAMGGNFESIMDVRLGIAKKTDGECIKLDGMQRQQVQTALLVALWCIQVRPMNRPSMSEVVQYLEGIAAINEQPPRPSIASHIISTSVEQNFMYQSSDLRYIDITPISGGR